MRLSRATSDRNTGWAARVGSLQIASELRVTGTFGVIPFLVNRGHEIRPTVCKNGWSGRNALENDWSLLLRRLKAVPISANAARLTVSLIIGMRYSKFP